ncbi:MAG: hypothetical protein ABI461_21865 [Polyangiaceae bacterium]
MGYASVGCAQERDPINQVQADALDKHFFVGASLSDNTDDPEFYMRNTIVDVPNGDSNGIFTAYYSQPLSRIKWEIQEDNLIARLTYEAITNSDGHGSKTSNNGQIVGMWTITSHFDIRRSYNPQTGEELNLIGENSTDRPWYQREYFRVDWSKNLITDAYSLDSLSGAGLQGVKFDAESYYVQDPNDPNAPTFDQDNGYFDVTTKALATPQIIDTPYGAYPACFFTSTIPTLNCNPTEVTLRLAFKKVVDHDYEPKDWDGNKMDAFGWFTEDRIGYDRNYGVLDDNWHRFAAMYNIWDKSHIDGAECAIDYWRDANNNIINYKVNDDGSFATDGATGLPIPDPKGQPHPGTPIGADVHRDTNKNGTEDECEFADGAGNAVHSGSRCDQFSHKCDLPLHERTTKTIPWYFGGDGAPDLFASTARALNEWNVAVLRSALIGQNVEAARVSGTTPVPSSFNLATEDALAADQAPGATAQFKPIFTLCHNPTIATDNVACFKHNSAGELLKGADGNPIMVSARIGDIRYNFVDMVANPMSDSPWGIMVDANDPLTGEKVTTSVNEWASVLDFAAQGTEDLLRWINGEISDQQITSGSYLRDWVNASKLGTGQYNPGTMTHEQIMSAASSITNPALTTKVGPNGEGAYTSKLAPGAFLAAASKKLAQSQGGSLDAVFEGNRQKLLGSQFETQMVTPMQLQRAGFNPNATPIAGNGPALAKASPLQGMNPQVKQWVQRLKDQNSGGHASCQIEQPEPDALVGMARQAQRLYPLPQDAAKGSPGYAPVGDANYAPLKAQRDQALHQWIREQFNVSVIAHEMGHSMGLRHNFTGSWDSMNYKPQYWQLRTENGKEKACADITQPNVDGHTCVGPRWIDPVTDEETNGLIWKWGSSTVMDYPGDQTQDMNDIGSYDKAAMRYGYADLADVDATKRSGPAKNLYDGRYDGFGGISGPFDITAYGTKGPSSVHYSSFNDMLNLVGTCTPQTDPNDALSAHCDGVALDFVASRDMLDGTSLIYGSTVSREHDKQGRLRHPYMFGSDEFADFGNMPVFRFDSGADAYEQAQFITATYENRYIFNNFRRDRTTFDTDAVVSRTESRYFDKLTSATKALGLYTVELGDQAGSFLDPVQGAGLLFPHTLASAISMNEFIKIITRPEPGIYNVTNANGVAMIDRQSQAPGMVNIPVGSGDGRYINNDYDYSKGYWWSSYQTQVGSYYEKVDAIYRLTEAYNNFVQNSRDQYVDGRYLNINYSTLYPDQMRRFFSGIMQNDLSSFAPYVMGASQGNSSTVPTASVQYLPWQGRAQLAYPTGATPIDPVIGWEEQFPALIYGFYFGGTTLSQDWIDQMRIYSPGGTDSVTLAPAEQVVYDDPATSIQYIARNYGQEAVTGKTVMSTSGARMLQYASSLAKATFQPGAPDSDTRLGHMTYVSDGAGGSKCLPDFVAPYPQTIPPTTSTPFVNLDPGVCAANKQTLRNFSSNIDSVRQLTSYFGYGPLNNR